MKKTIIFGFLFSLLSSAALASCPNLSGRYFFSEKTVVEFEQTGCEQLIRTKGLVETNGSISWFSPEVFEEKQLCNAQGLCEAANITFSEIRFVRNYDSVVMTEAHGRCIQRDYTLYFDINQRLYATFLIKNCSDGAFTNGEYGLFTKRLVKF